MCMGAMRVYSGSKPFVDDFKDKFSEVAQWQLFFALFAALVMKVNLDNENLQDRGYFDMILTCIQFVPALIISATNFLNAIIANDEAKGKLLGSFRKNRGAGERGLEMGDIVTNPVTGTAPQPAKVKQVKLEVANWEERSLSKQAVELGGEVVSKHELRKAGEGGEQEAATGGKKSTRRVREA